MQIEVQHGGRTGGGRLRRLRRPGACATVLVAALRSRRGASFRLLELLRKERLQIAVSVPLVFEYEAVLRVRVLTPSEFLPLVEEDV